MIYAYDQNVQLPVKDLYDNQVIAMSIAAAKDMYEKGQKEIKDVFDKYSDFYSPIQGATEDVYNTGIGAVKKELDKLYKAGIDPLRSPEGRQAISRIINGIDVGRINRRRQEAELAKQYIKNRDIAIMNGTYNPDFERAVNGGKLLEEWTANDGYWTNTAPAKYMSQDDIISPLAKQLNPEFDAVRTAKENDGYDYKTVNEDRIRQMVNDNLDDLIGKSTVGRFYYNQALQAAGGDADKAKQLLADQYTQIAKKHTKEDRELNQYKYQRVQAAERRAQMREQAALNYHYDQLKNWDFDGDGKIDASENDAKRRYKEAQIERYRNVGKGRTSYDGYPNIFDEADRKPEQMVEFKSAYAYENKISPNSDKVVLSTGGTYTISKKDISDLVYDGEILTEDGRGFKPGTFSTNKEIYAIPASGIIRKNLRTRDPKTGRIKIHKDKYAYYMRVSLQKETGVDDKGNTTYGSVSNDDQGYALMRIKERDANYAEQQKKDKTVDRD